VVRARGLPGGVLKGWGKASLCFSGPRVAVFAMSCEKQEGMSLQVSAKQFVYEFRKKVWLTEGLTHDAKSPICGCGSFFELTNPSQVEEQGLGFPREHFLFGRSVVEGELGIGAYQSFLAERNLSEEEGDALLTEAFRVCRPLELHALSAIVTRTEKLCASVLEISQERKEMTCDKYKGTVVGESSWPFVSHRCSTARGTVTGEELTTLHHSILPASLNETRGHRGPAGTAERGMENGATREGCGGRNEHLAGGDLRL